MVFQNINNKITLSLSKCSGLRSGSYLDKFSMSNQKEAFETPLKNTKIVCDGLITCDLISVDMRVPISGFVNCNKIPHVFFKL
jgi:hypothetical protein